MKKQYKRGAALAAALIGLSLLAGCSGGTAADSSAAAAGESLPAADKTAVRVVAIKGPTGVGMVNLMKAQDEGTAANTYEFTVTDSPEEASAKLTSGEADMAAVPTNLAANLYAKTSGGVKMLAVNTLGVLYMLEDGDTIQTVADLKGKTIYSTGQGANPEYVLRYILTKNGLDPDKDVTLVFKSQNDELATLLATGEAKVALVPEPVVSTVKAKKSTLRTALDMTAEWDKAAGNGSRLMMGCIAVRSEFAEKNGAAVKAFLTEYKASIDKAGSDLDGTAALCEQYGIIPKAAVAKQAIPGCSLTFLAGRDMMKQIGGYFQVLYDANPKSIGGALPDDAFYYNAQ